MDIEIIPFKSNGFALHIAKDSDSNTVHTYMSYNTPLLQLVFRPFDGTIIGTYDVVATYEVLYTDYKFYTPQTRTHQEKLQAMFPDNYRLREHRDEQKAVDGKDFFKVRAGSF